MSLTSKTDNQLPKPTVIYVRLSYYYKKDGYRQRNVRQFLHILASPGYAHGTIAVNVTVHGWKQESMLVKRKAAYTHLSSTVYEL